MTNDSAIQIEEKSLVLRASLGDEAAFSVIVTRHKNAVYNLCNRYLKGVDVEDAAQETFIRAFVHRERLDINKPILPWLLTVARYLCIDKLRAKNRTLHSDTPLETLPGSTSDAEQGILEKQQLILLKQGLLNLPQDQREAVALYHMEELSYKEIAEVMDAPIGTIMAWLHRGRQKLKEIVRYKKYADPKKVKLG